MLYWYTNSSHFKQPLNSVDSAKVGKQRASATRPRRREGGERRKTCRVDGYCYTVTTTKKTPILPPELEPPLSPFLGPFVGVWKESIPFVGTRAKKGVGFGRIVSLSGLSKEKSTGLLKKKKKRRERKKRRRTRAWHLRNQDLD